MTRPNDRVHALHAPHDGLTRSIPRRAIVPVDEDGSLVAEYGLLVVLGATITMLATKWASGGAIWSLFGSVLSKAKGLVGM